ncbi:MAG: glycosyltransferase [Planctomycetota bacterium]
MIHASIIIPTYNRGKLLCNTLRHLAKLLPADVEIIVVDQSDDVYPGLMGNHFQTSGVRVRMG